MRFDNCAIVIEQEPEDAGCSAYSPSLPDCCSNGRTIEAARRNMRKTTQHVTSLLAHGDDRSAGPARCCRRFAHRLTRPAATRIPRVPRTTGTKG